jgi:hypothetical protein
MPHDAFGLPLSTSPAAAEAYELGVDRLLTGQPGFREAFDRAAQEDPGFALAHVARARALQIVGRGAEAREAVAVARGLAGGATARERGQVEALGRVVTGDPGALAASCEHLRAFPRDGMIVAPVAAVFGLFGLSGRPRRNEELLGFLGELAPHWGETTPYGAWFLAWYAFVHTELGQRARGRELAERAIAGLPHNANAAHSMAHVFYEADAADEGAAYLEAWLAGYDRGGLLHGHLSWHQALLELAAGRPAKLFALYRAAVAPTAVPADAPPMSVLTDAVSLLWRAALAGQEAPAGAWEEVRAYAAARFPGPAAAYLDVHAAAAYALAGDLPAAERVEAGLRAAADEGRLPAGDVAPAIAGAMIAFARGDLARAARTLEPHAGAFVRVGGSWAQRDLFLHTLLVAEARQGEAARARDVLARDAGRPASRFGEALVARAASA